MLKGTFIALLAASILTPAWASNVVEQAIRSDTAEQAVEIATEEILQLIHAGQAYVKDDPERFYTEIEGLLRPLIDFRRFARNVMGPYYRSANTEQRARFAESFKWSLVRTYALALSEFGNGEVDVLPQRRPPSDPNKVNVSMEIKHGGKIYVVVYRMRRGKEQTWRMQNLVVEGINIGLNYKSQFTAAMKDPQWGGDMDAVIDAWTRVINSEDSEEPEQPQVSDEESGAAKDDDASASASLTTAAD